MKKIIFILVLVLILGLVSGCSKQETEYEIIATTLPVYHFTTVICAETGIGVGQLITENVSCLHDYTLQTAQMRMVENSKVIVVSGAGLEDFLDNTLQEKDTVIHASVGIELLHAEDCDHAHTNHSHEDDPHIWLSPNNAKIMANNIYNGLVQLYPEFKEVFYKNLQSLQADLEQLQSYGETALTSLSSRDLITFHDGFAYFANAFNLNILHAVEEESGSEASAAELTHLIQLVDEHGVPAIFVETNGSTAAAGVIAAETGVEIYTIDMAMSASSYFDAMYHNIDTIKEALE